jgi:hypothetical protein
VLRMGLYYFYSFQQTGSLSPMLDTDANNLHTPHDCITWVRVPLPASDEFGHSQFKTQKSDVGWDYHELMSGHDAMITAPNELVKLLESLRD